MNATQIVIFVSKTEIAIRDNIFNEIKTLSNRIKQLIIENLVCKNIYKLMCNVIETFMAKQQSNLFIEFITLIHVTLGA